MGIALIIPVFASVVIALAYLSWSAWLIKGLKNVVSVPVGDKGAGTCKVSVVIAARNEEKNIGTCLISIVRMGLPGNAEIIVVDDHSEDATAGTVRAFIQKCPQIKLVELPEGKSGKKEAITGGIDKAGGELILLTDADCIVPENWIEDITNFYSKDKPAMIIMPVLMNTGRNFFEKLQALEFFSLVAVTASAAAQARPVMCNGAALAYRKDVFKDLKGYSGNLHFPSGDDMMLMQEIKRDGKYSVAWFYNGTACVQTPAQPGLRKFFDQRTRWASKTKHYSDKRTTALALFVFLASVMPLLLCAEAIVMHLGSLLSLAFYFFIFKTGIDLLFLLLAAKIFKTSLNFALFFTAAVLYPFYILTVGFASVFVPVKWKGRKYHA
ncbi:MAG TPA: glycosyltransferase [Bacteroidia bacterium]|jgi:cellulose synthase/poly-beta-1,6-N-acetylglucosamine synthase-like glycosyltransferase